MTKKKKDIAVKEDTAVVGYEEHGAWGGEDIGSDDILLPRLLLMQSMSEWVAEDEKFQAGDFVDSLTEKLIAEKGKTFDCIVFGSEKKLIEYVNDEFNAMNDYTPNYEYEFTNATGDVVRNVLLIQYYVLLVGDIEKGEVFPYALGFKGTAAKVGKKLATQIKKLQVLKQPSAARVFTIGTEKAKNDKGTWFAPTVEMGRATTEEEMAEAYTWYKSLMSTKNFKVDDSDLKTDSETTTAQPRTAPANNEEPQVQV